MKICVTGANGHVGKVVTSDLILHGHDVIPVYRTESTQNIGSSLIGDLSNQNLFDRLRQVPDVIVHTAANIPLGVNETEIASQNRTIDDHVISYCDNNKVPLVFTSTAYLYDGWKGSEYLNEGDPVFASGSYYEEKLISEKQIASRLRRFTILRLSSPYGPHKRNENVIIKFIRRALEGKDLMLNGAGTKLQDFIHEDDVAYIVRKCIHDSIEGIFNCVYGKSVSMFELAELILRLIQNSNSRIIFSGIPDIHEDVNIRFSNAKLKAAGIIPRTSLEQGLKDLIKHYKNKRLEE